VDRVFPWQIKDLREVVGALSIWHHRHLDSRRLFLRLVKVCWVEWLKNPRVRWSLTFTVIPKPAENRYWRSH